MSIAKSKFKQAVLFLSVLTITLVFGLISVIHVSAQTEAQVTTNYQQRKADIEARKASIDQALNESLADYADFSTRRKTLAEEREARNSEIKKIEDQIVSINVITSEIKKQQDVLKTQLDDLVQQQGSLFVELQRENRIPLIARAFAGNIRESIEKMLYFNSLNEQAINLSNKIDETNVQLQDTLREQEEIKNQLESTKTLVASKRFDLDQLLKQTDGEESKYQQLMKDLEEQQKQSQSALEQAGVQYQQELARIREQARQQARNNLISTPPTSYARPAPTGCFFEVTGMNAEGFFGPVTRGIIFQGFSCNHDGIDISASIGTPVLAVAPGRVVSKNTVPNGYNDGRGNYVVLEITTPDGKRVYAQYWHMQRPSPLNVGDSVQRGQVVGAIGCSGMCYGPHVHFIMVADTLDNGPICGNYGYFGRAKCYNPLRYIPNIGGASF